MTISIDDFIQELNISFLTLKQRRELLGSIGGLDVNKQVSIILTKLFSTLVPVNRSAPCAIRFIQDNEYVQTLILEFGGSLDEVISMLSEDKC